MPGSGMSPCAACKLLRRRCARDCVFAPHFPPDEPQKFANVHKVFGAANVNKMLQVLPQLVTCLQTATLQTSSSGKFSTVTLTHNLSLIFFYEGADHHKDKITGYTFNVLPRP